MTVVKAYANFDTYLSKERDKRIPAKEEPIKQGEMISIEFGGKVMAPMSRRTCGEGVAFELPHP